MLTCVAVVDFLLFLGVCLLYIDNDAFAPEQPPASRDDGDGAAVKLLVWVHPYGDTSPLPDCDKRFGIRGCRLTDDRNAYREADAVVIHHRDVADGSSLPTEPRPRAQAWIWLNYESPTHSPNLTLFEGVFNLTMSYRTDSNIFLPYGCLVPRGHGNEGGAALCASTPSRLLRPYLLAWVVSHWSESHARVAFYRELSRHVDVDVYGDVYEGEPLPRGEGSVVRVVSQYQFYLALENSQHTDYITEKLWNALQAGAIPVVLGPSRENYERFLPPEAFIHVDDFSTVLGLVQYLHTLWGNAELLRHHLDWRDRFSIHQPEFWTEHYCTACKAVRERRGRTAVVHDLEQWFKS